MSNFPWYLYIVLYCASTEDTTSGFRIVQYHVSSHISQKGYFRKRDGDLLHPSEPPSIVAERPVHFRASQGQALVLGRISAPSSSATSTTVSPASKSRPRAPVISATGNLPLSCHSVLSPHFFSPPRRILFCHYGCFLSNFVRPPHPRCVFPFVSVCVFYFHLCRQVVVQFPPNVFSSWQPHASHPQGPVGGIEHDTDPSPPPQDIELTRDGSLSR